MSLKDYLGAAILVEGAVWKSADVPVLKSDNSCNWLITLGRCEPHCSGRGDGGSHEDCRKAPASGGRQFVFDAAEKLPASGGFRRPCLLAKVVGCDGVPDFCCMWVLPLPLSPHSSYLSFSLSYLLFSLSYCCCLLDSATHSSGAGEKPSQARL